MKVRPAKFSDSAEIVEIWNPYIKKHLSHLMPLKRLKKKFASLSKIDAIMDMNFG